MAKLLAKSEMVKHHRLLVRQKRILAALTGERPSRGVPVPVPVPAASGQRRAPEALSGEPTPERAVHAAGIAKALAPPFNSRVLDVPQKFARALGPELMIVLERLYEVAMIGMTSRGLTQSFEPRIDGSAGGYEHLSAVSRDAHEQFHSVMDRMPAELRPLVRELVLEDIGIEINSARGAPPRRARSVKEIGQELSGYEGEQRAMGAVVAALRIIAWHARAELGFKRRK
jgi:hypothetical protein